MRPWDRTTHYDQPRVAHLASLFGVHVNPNTVLPLWATTSDTYPQSWIIALDSYQRILVHRQDKTAVVAYAEVPLGISVILTAQYCDLGDAPLRSHTRQISGSTDDVLPYTPVDLRKPFEHKGRNSVRDPILIQIVPRRLLPTGVDLIVPAEVFYDNIWHRLLGDIPLNDPTGITTAPTLAAAMNVGAGPVASVAMSDVNQNTSGTTYGSAATGPTP
ncbi:hypothetical protein HDU93_009182, partial [Gonapodya sp. JEL0774]